MLLGCRLRVRPLNAQEAVVGVGVTSAMDRVLTALCDKSILRRDSWASSSFSVRELSHFLLWFAARACAARLLPFGSVQAAHEDAVLSLIGLHSAHRDRRSH